MTYKQILETIEAADFAVDGLGQERKPGKAAVQRARREGRLIGRYMDYVVIASNNPRTEFTCRVTKAEREEEEEV